MKNDQKDGGGGHPFSLDFSSTPYLYFVTRGSEFCPKKIIYEPARSLN